MRVLAVYAHPNPSSFCHAVLEQFTAGLKHAGHTSEVIDLYAIKFNPVFSMRDFVQFVDERYTPKDVLDGMNLKQFVPDSSGGPLRRFIASRWLRHKDLSAVIRLIRKGMPRDVLALKTISLIGANTRIKAYHAQPKGGDEHRLTTVRGRETRTPFGSLEMKWGGRRIDGRSHSTRDPAR